MERVQVRHFETIGKDAKEQCYYSPQELGEFYEEYCRELELEEQGVRIAAAAAESSEDVSAVPGVEHAVVDS